MVSEEVGAPKPDPRMINMTLNKYFANKKDAVMLGDSLSADIAAAQNAGIDSIWLHRPTHTEISSPATYNVNCLEEAESILLQ
jgi:FMN phosphatase YigB (HAD superfamily)